MPRAISLLTGISLLCLSWGIANHFFAGMFEPGASSGRLILLTGGLPWLLQWAAIGSLFNPLPCRKPRRWAKVNLFGAATPLLPAAFWWGGLVLLTRGDSILEGFSRLALSAGWQGDLVWFFGVLLNPLRLRPPEMQGLEYFWSGASTAL